MTAAQHRSAPLSEPATLPAASAAAADCGLRVLIDPYLCFGPGAEPLAPTIVAIAQRCAALGLRLCVENRTWQEAARDPDVPHFPHIAGVISG